MNQIIFLIASSYADVLQLGVLVFGSIWTYSVIARVDGDPASKNYCDRLCFRFSLFLVVGFTALAGIIIIFGVINCLCKTKTWYSSVSQKEKDNTLEES